MRKFAIFLFILQANLLYVTDSQAKNVYSVDKTGMTSQLELVISNLLKPNPTQPLIFAPNRTHVAVVNWPNPTNHRYWRRGVVVIVVRRMNEVTLRRSQLVLGWVTVFGRVYHHGT